jgi:hypothetical protein
MTLQELKDNREQIIEIIEYNVTDAPVKSVMQEMVKYIGFRDFEGMNVEDFTLAVIAQDTYDKPQHVNTLWGAGCKYSTQDEYQRACLGSKWNK